MDDRRAESRTAVMVRVEVSWQDAAGVEHTCQATLEDRSRHGVAIRLSEALPVGSQLQIKSPNGEFSCEVVHCRRGAKGFVVGLRRNTNERPATRA